MLRCPKCGCVYQDNTQKFCTTDGARITGEGEKTVQQVPSHHLPRLTPPGELLSEKFVSPSDNLIAGAAAPTTRASAASFQSFGLHPSNIPDILRGVKATNGFHSFDSLVVDGRKSGKAKPEANSRDSSLNRLDDSFWQSETQKLNTSFIIICLLGALLFLTGLAFAATYVFRDRKSTSAPNVRETSTVISSAVKQADALLLSSNSYSNAENFDIKFTG